MRFFFRQNPTRRELDEVRRRIAELRRDIERIEQSSQSPARQADGADAYRSVFQVRTAMVLEDLIQKGAELAQLMEREAALLAQAPEPGPRAGERVARHPVDSGRGPAPVSPPTPEETPPAVAGEPAAAEVGERPAPQPEMGSPPAPEPTMEPVAEVAAAPGAAIGAGGAQATIPEREPQLEGEAVPAEPGLAGAPAEPDASETRRRSSWRLRAGTLALVGGLIVVVGGLGGIFFGGVLRPPRDGGQPAPGPVAVVAPATTTVPTAVPPTPVPATPVPPTLVSPTPALPPTPRPEPTPQPTPLPVVVAEPTAEPEPEDFEEPAVDTTTILAPAGFRGAYLRSAPSTSAPSLGLLRNGTLVEVLEGSTRASGFRWIRVRTSDGVEGWVVATAART